MNTSARKILLACVALALFGCKATMRSYSEESKETQVQATGNNPDQALANLEKNNAQEKDLLYYLEKGELLRLDNKISDSRDAWLQADEKVRLWEEEAKNRPEALIGDLGALVINDKTRRYDGQDYEKIMLSTRLALDHVALGQWDKARTEIKKTHEREAVIAALRAKEVQKLEQQSKTQGITLKTQDLKGYPVETLNDPAVTALKNSYQSALSHYLAGFVYEALREPSLAAPGYRKAIELRPGSGILEEGLRGLDARMKNTRPNTTEVLFIVESGNIPGRKSVTLPIPIPYQGSVSVIPLSFPVIQPDTSPQPAQIQLHGKTITSIKLAPITNLDAMARRALKDEMPGIILRTAVRAVAKSAAQKKVADRGGQFASMLSSVTAVATETADERGWRTLPAQIAIARITLVPGTYTIGIPANQKEEQVKVNISGKYAVVPIRLMGNGVFQPHPILAQTP